MGIAEHGKAFRRQFHYQLGTFLTAFWRLVGQAVHQVEVDAVDAGAAQCRDRTLGYSVGLNTVDGALNGRVEILHAEAGAVDARPRQGGRRFGGQRARVDFDRDLAVRLHREAGADMGQQSFEIGGFYHGRRAAAEMDVAYREAAWQGRGDQVDLLPQQAEIL